MLEVGLEVGDLGDRRVHGIFILVVAADDKAELFIAEVAIAGVDATDSVVLLIADVWCLVLMDGQPLVVEEVVDVHGALNVVISPVGGGFVDVEAQSLTFAHATDEVLADEISHSCVVLSAKGNLDYFRGEVGELCLVVHERGDTA